MSDHFQLLADCPCGLVEGGQVEFYDQREPCCHLGVPLEARCRLCGLATRGQVRGEGELPQKAPRDMIEERCPRCDNSLGEADRQERRCSTCGLEAFAQEIRPRGALDSQEALRRALDRWAIEEGCADARELLEVSFGELSLEQAFAQVQAGQKLETSFDVLGFLFSHVGGGGSVGGLQASEQEGQVQGQHPSPQDPEASWGYAPTSRIELPQHRAPHRRNRALALISVMAVDGEIRPGERAYIERYLAQEELAPLREEEIRVRRPHEVGPVGSLRDREALVEHMLALAHIDEEKDESEIRLIREFARHWGVDPARIDDWVEQHDLSHTSRPQRWLRKVRALLLA